MRHLLQISVVLILAANLTVARQSDDIAPGDNLFVDGIPKILLHEQTGDIEVAQRALGHARRSTTEDVYDHAERIVDEETTSILVQVILGDTNILHSEAVN